MAGRIGGAFDADVATLRERVRSLPPAPTQATIPPHSRWTLAQLRMACAFLRDYSLGGVSTYVRGSGIKFRHGRPQSFSPDPQYAQKEAKVLAALRDVGEHPGQAIALFIDEMSYTRWPQPSLNWCEQAPAPRPLAARHQSRYQRYRVVGALDAWTGRVSFRQDSHISGEVFSRFLRQLDQAYPKAQRLYLMGDNWPGHSCELVQQTLRALPRLLVVGLPTYAPWLNPAEKLWRWFRQDVDYLHPLANDWNALPERVGTFFAQFADGSEALLRYVGLCGTGKLARALHSGP
jgi:transposase